MAAQGRGVDIPPNGHATGGLVGREGATTGPDAKIVDAKQLHPLGIRGILQSGLQLGSEDEAAVVLDVLDSERERVLVGEEAGASLIQMEVTANNLAEFVEGYSDFLGGDFVHGFGGWFFELVVF